MNILFITDELSPGGVPAHVIDVANYMHHAGNVVTVAATPGNYRVKLDQNIRFVPLSLLHVGTFKKNFTGIVPSIYRLLQLCKNSRFDIIHSHTRYSQLVAAIVASVFSVSLITSYHNTFSKKKKISVFGDYVICCGETVRKVVVDDFGANPKKTRTVYNGINAFRNYDDNEIQNIRTTLNIPTDARVISSTAQFRTSKDRESLIRAFHRVIQNGEFKNTILLLQGHGELEEYLRSLVKQLGLQEKIIFIDSMYNVEAIMNISEFMVLNSLQEGFSIVLLEGGSIGKPYIGSNISEITEFIEDGVNGLLVPPKNPEALAEAIKYLLKNPDKTHEYGQNAIKKYQALFTRQRMMDELLEVYHMVINKKESI
ncbi:MAG: glycosyltransferase family 4 protein [Bacteroidota bacterium]